MACSAQGFVLP